MTHIACVDQLAELPFIKFCTLQNEKKMTMFAGIAFIILFFGLPIWGSYTGANIALWALAGVAMIAAAGGCLWAQYCIESKVKR